MNKPIAFIPEKTRILKNHSYAEEYIFLPQYQHGLLMRLFNIWHYYKEYCYDSLGDKWEWNISFTNEQYATDFVKSNPPKRRNISKHEIINL